MKIPHPFSPFPVWSEKGVLVNRYSGTIKPEPQNTAQDTRVGEDAFVEEGTIGVEEEEEK